MERLKTKKEILRVSTIEDYYLFKQLTTEAQLNDRLDVVCLNVGELKLFKDAPYLEAARTGLRLMTLQKEGCLPLWPSREGNRLFSMDRIITCFDVNNQIIYEGNIADCPFPARNLFLQAGMNNDWHVVCFWNLGNVKDLKSHQTSTGCLLLKEPGVFLFTVELAGLATGEFITVQKHQPWIGYVSQIFEGYQIIGGKTFRIWASYTD